MKTLAVGKAYMKSSTIGTNIVLDSSEKIRKKRGEHNEKDIY